MLLVLLQLGSQTWTLEVAACWIGFQFGGNLALFPLLTAEYFGTRHLGGNYALVFTAYGVGGVAGPMLAGGVWDLLELVPLGLSVSRRRLPGDDVAGRLRPVAAPRASSATTPATDRGAPSTTSAGVSARLQALSGDARVLALVRN